MSLFGARRRPRVLLVSKQDCGLCDEAKEALEHARARVDYDLEVRSIDDDASLREAHALEVPVIFIDGRKKFFGRVSLPLLLRELRGAAG